MSMSKNSSNNTKKKDEEMFMVLCVHRILFVLRICSSRRKDVKLKIALFTPVSIS